jgi:hypothetical protein
MDIIAIIELIKLMTFTEASKAYVNGVIDDDTYDAYGFVWSTSADRGPTYAAFMQYPTTDRGHEIVKALTRISPHPYAGAY